MAFVDRLRQAWESSDSLLCVGLDPDADRLPEPCREAERPFFHFTTTVAEAAAPVACAFKPQFAHFAAAGRLAELRDLIGFLRKRFPRLPVILDAKRGDIGSTAAFYAREAFDRYDADAVTANPYLGGDALEPFLADRDRGVFLLCRTSNPGSADLQGLIADGQPVFLHVATRAARDWNANHNLGLVAGATWPEELGAIRRAAPELPLLVPGIGAQGGDLAAVLRHGLTPDGTGLLINASRSILYARSGSDFAEGAAEAARELRDQINRLRPA